MKGTHFFSLKLVLILTVAWLSVVSDLLLLLLNRLQNYSLSRKKRSQLNKFNFKFFKFGKEKMASDPLGKLIQSLSETQDEIKYAWANSFSTRQTLQKHLKAAYNFVPHSDLILTAVGTLSIAWFLRRSLHRYKNANDLPLSFFEGKRQKRLKGLAVSVNDSDNIRFYHQPHFYSFFRPSLARQDLKFHTINIRLAGIDAPEVKRDNYNNNNNYNCIYISPYLRVYILRFRWHISDQSHNHSLLKPRSG